MTSDQSNISQASPNRKTMEERAEALGRLVATQVARGRRVESQTNVNAVLVRGKPVNHILHLLLCVPTVGFWVLIWIGLVAFGGERREMVTVDEWGNTAVSDLGR